MKKLLLTAALATLAACDGAIEPRPEPTLTPIEDECRDGEACQ